MAYEVRQFYNLEGPVGKGVIGRPDDILLVKFFLTELAKVDMTWNAETPDSALIVDGQPSDALNEWIWAYQQMKKNFRSAPVVVDGRVDPVPGYSSTRTPRQNAVYILSWMNSDFEVLFPERFHHLVFDDKTPSALQEALQNRSR
jgi:hypothetical protein